MSLKNLINIFCIGILAFLTSGCAAYTGVDTTAKITAKDVRRQGVTVTAEQSLLGDIAPVPPRDWQPGMMFAVTDKRVNMIFDAASDATDSIAHGTLLALVSAQGVPTYTGREVAELQFTDSLGHRLIYRTSASYADFIEGSHFVVPFLYQKAMLDSVASRLVGKQLYILQQRRLDANGDPVNGLRYQPVTVTGVTLGSDVQPLKVWFDTADGQRQALMLTVGAFSGDILNFNSLFAINNPRKQHDDISDENWTLITQSRVALGMTRDECRLALGRPAAVQHLSTTMGPGEQWTYENGVYLIFIDGALAKFRQ